MEDHSNLFKLHLGTVIRGAPMYRASDKTVHVRYAKRGSDNETRSSFGAILYARGAGKERVTIGPEQARYRGYRFWETDPFEERNLGLSVNGEPRRVLICGSGDGALQDFLRIATGMKSAKEIMQAILPSFDARLLHQLYSEEDQGARAKVSNGLRWDHHVQLRLDRVHRHIAAQLLPADRSNVSLEKQIETLLGHSRTTELRLIHLCKHFTAMYPLNRFLVHLLHRYAKVADLTERIDILSNRGLAVVVCRNHKPTKNHNTCHGLEHLVILSKQPDCQPSAASHLIQVERPFHAIIIRFGPEPSPGPHLLINRHTLPYHSAL
jgi:hypothetical protein